MTEKKKLVVVITNGLDNERSSVAWSVANGGINSGLDVSIFLVSSGVDWVRRGAGTLPRLNPMDPPIGEMIRNAINSGCPIGVCPPCASVRGYTQDDFIDGVTIVGSTAIHEPVKQGAAVVTF